MLDGSSEEEVSKDDQRVSEQTTKYVDRSSLCQRRQMMLHVFTFLFFVSDLIEQQCLSREYSTRQNDCSIARFNQTQRLTESQIGVKCVPRRATNKTKIVVCLTFVFLFERQVRKTFSFIDLLHAHASSYPIGAERR